MVQRMELDRPPSGATDRPDSVLLLEDAQSGAADRLCGELLTVAAPDETGLLIVSLVQSPGARLAVWDDAAAERPAKTVVVTVANGVGDAADGTAIDVRMLPDPSNLTRLGVTLTESLAALEGTRPVVCFHSLTVLLQYADLKRVFRFLSVLQSHLKAADARAHFHLNPGSHDGQTVATLRHLFDAVVGADDC